MPTVAYEQLLAETLPARVQNDEEYDLIRSRFGDLLSKRRRTVAEGQIDGPARGAGRGLRPPP
jgi:hypothetical protein